MLKAKVCIVKSVQNECYSEELKCINSGSNIPPSSSLWKLHPILDQNQLLGVGGRIEQSGRSMNEVHPIIVPGRHHLATLLVSHYHGAVKHQGRHLTKGAIRTAGFWLVGAKRCISSLLHRCVTCRRLRGKMEHQQMAALPADGSSASRTATSSTSFHLCRCQRFWTLGICLTPYKSRRLQL